MLYCCSPNNNWLCVDVDVLASGHCSSTDWHTGSWGSGRLHVCPSLCCCSSCFRLDEAGRVPVIITPAGVICSLPVLKLHGEAHWPSGPLITLYGFRLKDRTRLKPVVGHMVRTVGFMWGRAETHSSYLHDQVSWICKAWHGTVLVGQAASKAQRENPHHCKFARSCLFVLFLIKVFYNV